MSDVPDELLRLFEASQETTPSLVLPDLAERPLQNCETFVANGFLYSGRRSIGNQVLREKTISVYGFALPCREAIEACLARSPLIEVGAGCAFWAHLIARASGDVVSTDRFPTTPSSDGREPDWPWHPVEELAAVEAVKAYPDRTVLMIWPSLDKPWAADVLEAMAPGQVLIHVGEIGEATGDERFAQMIYSDGFEALDRIPVPNWPGIHDVIDIFRKRRG